jgi:hypothetical protein
MVGKIADAIIEGKTETESSLDAQSYDEQYSDLAADAADADADAEPALA